MYQRYLPARTRLSVTIAFSSMNVTVHNIMRPLGHCAAVAPGSHEVGIRIRLTCLTISYLSKK